MIKIASRPALRGPSDKFSELGVGIFPEKSSDFVQDSQPRNRI